MLFRSRNLDRLADLMMCPREDQPEVVWLWGKTGVGKTYQATHGLNVDEYYIWGGKKWWNGYRQQRRVVIDDFAWDGAEASFRELLRLTDRYAVQVENKGGMVHFNSPEIYITCEHSPEKVFGCAQFALHSEALAQLSRRLTRVTEVTLPEPVYIDERIDYGDMNEFITGDDDSPPKTLTPAMTSHIGRQMNAYQEYAKESHLEDAMSSVVAQVLATVPQVVPTSTGLGVLTIIPEQVELEDWEY